MFDPLTSGASGCVLLGRNGFFAAALAERLPALFGSRLRIVGSAELDLTAPGAADRLGRIVDGGTLLIAPARAPQGPDAFRTFADDIAIATTVARCVAANRPGCCVYFSSSSVYGDATSNPAITERTPLAPTGLYGASKVAAEAALRHAAERAGVPLFVLRPCMVYGPGNTSEPYGPDRFVRSILRDGKVRVFGDGDEVRDYLFVRDLVDVTLALALGGAPGTYNLATGTSHSFRQILAQLRDVVGAPFEVEMVPRDRPKTDQGFDASALLAALPGVRFTPLEEGLAETIAACRARRTA